MGLEQKGQSIIAACVLLRYLMCLSCRPVRSLIGFWSACLLPTQVVVINRDKADAAEETILEQNSILHPYFPKVL